MRYCTLFLFIHCMQCLTSQSSQLDTSLSGIKTGEIYFSTKMLTKDKIRVSQMSSRVELRHKSDLFMHIVLDQPFVQFAKKLAPDMNKNTLLHESNFQFSFFVDDALIYTTNLIPGAPSAGVKDTAHILSFPLIKYQNAYGALWSQYVWFRFFYNGGAVALTDGVHQLKIIVKPYVRINNEVKAGDLMASGSLQLDVQLNEPINTSAIHLNQPKPYPDLKVSKEKINQDKIKTLKGLCEQGKFKNINGIIVLKNHKILIEEYFNGAERTTLHDPRSVGKTFASTALGITIDKGFIKNEDQTLGAFYDVKRYANYTAAKSNTTLKELLTMSSSFDGDDDDGGSPGNEENMYPTENWVQFTLDLPMVESRPKNEWHYFTAGVVVLGDVIHRTVPNGLEYFLHHQLFKPLHIDHYKWQYTPQQVANTAGGIQMRALDFAKYGQLYKNKGVWKGKKILSPDWVSKSLTPHRVIPNRNNEYYGYLFWNKIYTVDGKNYETYYCAGNGGNKIFIFKDLPIVVVVTASAYGLPYAHPQVDRMMEEYILPAVID